MPASDEQSGAGGWDGVVVDRIGRSGRRRRRAHGSSWSPARGGVRATDHRRDSGALRALRSNGSGCGPSVGLGMMGGCPRSSSSTPTPTTRPRRPPGRWPELSTRATVSSSCSPRTATTVRSADGLPRARPWSTGAARGRGVRRGARAAPRSRGWLRRLGHDRLGPELARGRLHAAPPRRGGARFAAVLDEEDADVAGRLRLARRLRPPDHVQVHRVLHRGPSSPRDRRGCSSRR